MKNFLSVFGAMILIIAVRVIVKNLVINDVKNDLSQITQFKEALKDAKTSKDSIAVFLKYDRLKSEDFVDSIYKKQPDLNNSTIRFFESGGKRFFLDSILKIDYPYPIYKQYGDKIAEEVIRRNQNFNFNVDNKSNEEFANCIKKKLNGISEYTYVYNDNNSISAHVRT